MNRQKDNYHNIIKEIIANIKPSVKERIKDGDENLIEELELDSVDLMSLLVEIENEYGISFEDEVLLIENFATINRLAEFVKDLVNLEFE